MLVSLVEFCKIWQVFFVVFLAALELAKWQRCSSSHVNCRVVRPLRAKHCRICDRCVAQFDHHCPYIYNCVGLRNRASFLTFTLSVAVNCSITIFFAFYCISLEGWKLLYVVGLVEALIFCGLGWLLSGFTVGANYN